MIEKELPLVEQRLVASTTVPKDVAEVFEREIKVC